MYVSEPTRLDAETAGPYAAAYEEVYRYNRIVEEETEIIREIVVSVDFYWTFGGDRPDRPIGITDGEPYEATYFVNEATTDRLGDTL